MQSASHWSISIKTTLWTSHNSISTMMDSSMPSPFFILDMERNGAAQTNTVPSTPTESGHTNGVWGHKHSQAAPASRSESIISARLSGENLDQELEGSESLLMKQDTSLAFPTCTISTAEEAALEATVSCQTRGVSMAPNIILPVSPRGADCNLAGQPQLRLRRESTLLRQPPSKTQRYLSSTRSTKDSHQANIY